jgi:SRSO17 transposase
VAQRRGFREYLAGLLAPRERNKTLTALAGAEPVTGSKLPAVQRLQFFVSESVWEPDAVNARRLELLRADPATAPHGGGVLVIDDSGDRKDGTRTAHVGRQYLGRYGKTDNGVVTVTTVWADERIYYPVHAVPYTPARHFARGRTTRSSGPSWRSARISRSGRGRPGSRSGRSSRTAPTATRTGSAPGSRRPRCRS